jgi:hypothetical protein
MRAVAQWYLNIGLDGRLCTRIKCGGSGGRSTGLNGQEELKIEKHFKKVEKWQKKVDKSY